MSEPNLKPCVVTSSGKSGQPLAYDCVMETPSRDIYGRKPVSESRGRTDDRILAMQHDPDTLPGTEDLLDASMPSGSIGAVIQSFQVEWVKTQPITNRRAYERALMLLVHDLAQNGPSLSEPIERLTGDRLVAHLDWRWHAGMHHPTDFPRAAVNLARLLEHHHPSDDTALRDRLRDHVTALLNDGASQLS